MHAHAAPIIPLYRTFLTQCFTLILIKTMCACTYSGRIYQLFVLIRASDDSRCNSSIISGMQLECRNTRLEMSVVNFNARQCKRDKRPDNYATKTTLRLPKDASAWLLHMQGCRTEKGPPQLMTELHATTWLSSTFMNIVHLI